RTAAISVDAYPNSRFTGVITSMSVEAAFTPRNIQTRTDRDRLVYPVELKIKNDDMRLRPGMPAEARLTAQ
ncbi:MAG TPA: hypothetical protein VIV60_32725, partial [Polyangiaceae bacterium]